MFESFHGLVDDLGRAGRFCEVALHGDGCAVGFVRDVGLELGNAVAAAVGGVCTDDFGATGGEVKGDDGADASACAGYDCDLRSRVSQRISELRVSCSVQTLPSRVRGGAIVVMSESWYFEAKSTQLRCYRLLRGNGIY